MIDKNAHIENAQSWRFKIEEICTEYEQTWCSGSQSRINEFISELDDSIRPQAATELIAVDLELRAEAGENPQSSEYISCLPNYRTEVAKGFELWRLENSENNEEQNSVPDRIGDYKIIRKLGQGGMGVVYEAIQESLNRRVAIKTLGTHPIHAPKSARRFRREARAVAMLHHTNIINVYGSGVHDGVPYFAMQLVEGQSLSQIVAELKRMRVEAAKLGVRNPERGPLSFKKVALIGVHVASATHYAHQQGILHRDIKPSNLLLDEFGTTWVSDFGLAKLKNSVEATFSGDVVGTLRYLPPEATWGNWSELGDVYSLGITLYELLALQPAYPETDHVKLLDRITRGDPPTALRRIDPSIPRDLETIVNKAISREPTIRYQDAAELKKELQRFIDCEPIKARPASTSERVIKWSRRNPGPATSLAMILLLVTLGLPSLTLLWLRSESALESVQSERTKTEIAKMDAIVARKVAEIGRRDAEVSEYGSSMQLAQKYLEGGNIAEVYQLFEKWRPQVNADTDRVNPQSEHLGWEWHYLNRQLDQARLTLQGDMEYVWHVAVSPDDSLIATVHAKDPILESDLDSSEVIVWDARTGERIHVLQETNDRVFASAFSPDGATLVTIGMDLNEQNGSRGSLSIWNLEIGALEQDFDLPGQYIRKHLSVFEKPLLPNVCFSPNGRFIMTSPSPIEIRDFVTLEVINRFEGREAKFLDESSIAVLGFDGSITTYDLNSKIVIDKIAVGDGQTDLTVRNEVASTNMIDRMRIYKSNFTDVREFERQEVYWGAVAPKGDLLVAGDRGGKLTVSDLTKARSKDWNLVGHQSTITHGSFSRKGDWLATSSLDGTAKIWDVGSRVDNSVHSTNLKYEQLADLAFSPDGQRLNYVGRSRADGKQNIGWFALPAFPLVEGYSKRGHLEATFFANWPRTDFTFSNCGRYIAAPVKEKTNPKTKHFGFAKSGRIGIWAVADWERKATINVDLSEIYSLAWQNENRMIAIAGRKESQSVLEIHAVTFESSNLQSPSADTAINVRPMNKITLQGELVISAMDFHGDKLGVASPNRIDLLEIDSQCKEANAIFAKQRFSESGTARFLDFSPDGRFLAAAIKDKTRFRVFDLESGEMQYEKPAPKDVCCVRFSPDGKRIALSGYASLVYLCDAEFGHRLLSLPGSKVSSGSLSINSRVVFSPDGNRIATNNWQGVITVWETPLP